MNFSAGVNNNAIVSGDAGSDLLVFSSTVASSAVYGASGGDTLTFAGAISNPPLTSARTMTWPPLVVLSAAVPRSEVELVLTPWTSATSLLLRHLLLVALVLTCSWVVSRLVPVMSASGVVLVLTPSTSLAASVMASGTAYFWNDAGVDRPVDCPRNSFRQVFSSVLRPTVLCWSRGFLSDAFSASGLASALLQHVLRPPMRSPRLLAVRNNMVSS